MNLDDIQAFLALVAQQSLTKAAEVLHVSQSAISHRLKNLEQDLGLVLVKRGKGIKTISLTAAGEDFLLVAEKWLMLLQETQSLKARTRLTLAVGAVDSINTYILPDIYQEIMTKYPNLRLHIYTKNSSEIYDLLEQRTIDLGLVLHERIVKQAETVPMFAEPMVVIRLAVPEHQALTHIHPQQLSPRDELYHEWFPAYQVWHDKWWDRFQSSHVQVSNGPMVLPLLRLPQQWAIVPLSIAQSKAQSHQYTIQYLTEPPPDRVCYCLTHKQAKSRIAEAAAIFQEAAAKVLLQFEYLAKCR